MTRLRAARMTLLVGIAAYAFVLAGMFFRPLDAELAVLLTWCAVVLIAISAVAALMLELRSGSGESGNVRFPPKADAAAVASWQALR